MKVDTFADNENIVCR